MSRISRPTIPARIKIFPMSIPTIRAIPFEISVPILPARWGRFKGHTYDTHDTPVFRYFVTYHTGSISFFQKLYMRYPRYPGISTIRYLPYRLHDVCSNAMSTIPMILRYIEISVPTIPAPFCISKCHTCDSHAYPGCGTLTTVPVM